MLDLRLNPYDLAGIDKQLEAMQQKLDHFGKVEIGMIMSAWQTDDMHRHRPFTMRWRGAKRQAQTVVRPHSLRETLGLRRYLRKEKKLTKYRKVIRSLRQAIHRQYARWSTRPILREDIKSQLWQEMTDAFERAISWGKSKT